MICPRPSVSGQGAKDTPTTNGRATAGARGVQVPDGGRGDCRLASCGSDGPSDKKQQLCGRRCRPSQSRQISRPPAHRSYISHGDGQADRTAVEPLGTDSCQQQHRTETHIVHLHKAKEPGRKPTDPFPNYIRGGLVLPSRRDSKDLAQPFSVKLAATPP